VRKNKELEVKRGSWEIAENCGVQPGAMEE
jgi:hypothetical protein